MGFIFGLMIGSMAASGGSSTALPPALGSIPFRCLYAFEQSETDYRDCRRPSLAVEMNICQGAGYTDATGHCSRDRHLAWELGALRELKKSIEQQQAAKK